MENFKTTIAGFDITLSQDGADNFEVKYGRQVRGGLDYNNAALELGAALMHALACEGKLDNQEA